MTIGGLFLGWFSPTQAGAIGAGGALLIGLVRRQLSWKVFFESGKDDVIREGTAGYVVSFGETLYRALDAVTKLKAEGIQIARRTVAKYRDELGIPSSTDRKRVF